MNDHTYSWAQLREQAISSFGQLPKAETEQQIIDVFRNRPALVARLISELSADIAAGKGPRSGWAALRHRLQDGDVTDIQATDATDRQAAVKRIHHWIHNAGLYIDHEPELIDELFGETGKLRTHDTPALRNEMLAAWKSERPRAERADRAQEDYDAKCRESMRLMRAYRVRQKALQTQAAEPATLGTVAEDTRKP